MEQSVDSDFFKKLKAIAWLPIPYLAHISRFFLNKKDFSENQVDLDMRI